MEVKKVDHVPGKGSFAVFSTYGPKITVKVFGPATYSECKGFIQRESIWEKRS